MKKLFVIILSVFLCGTLFTSFSPSLDGRAVVAEEGSMPKGVFAKTVGYLPGDSISVTSLATKKTVDILVIGSIDSSEGVAILLSPEAAELLGLSKDLNNVVKITKRSGQLDEAVAGTAVIGGVVETPATEYDENSTIEIEPEQTESEMSEENEPKSYVEEISEPESEETEETAETEESAVEEIAEPEPESEQEVEPEVIETPEEESEYEQVEETSVEPEAVEEIAEPELESEQEVEAEVIETPEEEPVYEKTEEGEIEPETVEEIAEDPAQESVEEENLEEIAAAEIPEEKPEVQIIQDEITELEEDVPVESETVSENIPEEPEVIEAAENTEEAELVELEQLAENDELTGERIEEDNLDSLPAEKSVAVLPEEEIAEEPESETPEEENLESGEEESVSEVPFNEEAVALDELDELPSNSEKIEILAEPAVEKEAELSKTEEDESFEPIVLVPTDSNPPEQVESDSSVNKTELLVESETKTVESRTSEATSVVSEKNKTERSSAKTSLKKYTVNSLKELERGTYYVQIAVLADEKNIEDIVAKYKDQYPVTLVPLASGKATQVMIGPLNMDEYGTVLNRFKKSGYKDAFLRKIR